MDRICSGAATLRRSAVAVTGAGVTAGLLAAALAGRSLALAHLLYGVSPYDPATFAAGVVLAALAASAIPARRAARLDPMTALRAE